MTTYVFDNQISIIIATSIRIVLWIYLDNWSTRLNKTYLQKGNNKTSIAGSIMNLFNFEIKL